MDTGLSRNNLLAPHSKSVLKEGDSEIAKKKNNLVATDIPITNITSTELTTGNVIIEEEDSSQFEDAPVPAAAPTSSSSASGYTLKNSSNVYPGALQDISSSKPIPTSSSPAATRCPLDALASCAAREHAIMTDRKNSEILSNTSSLPVASSRSLKRSSSVILERAPARIAKRASSIGHGIPTKHAETTRLNSPEAPARAVSLDPQDTNLIIAAASNKKRIASPSLPFSNLSLQRIHSDGSFAMTKSTSLASPESPTPPSPNAVTSSQLANETVIPSNNCFASSKSWEHDDSGSNSQSNKGSNTKNKNHNSKKNISTTMESQSCTSSSQISVNDVLCGRGGLTNHHPGNVFFRKMVRHRQEDYLRASKRDKAGVARHIVETIRKLSPPGRFLKKDPTRSNTWMEIGDRKAREKTSQALREGAPELREELQQVCANQNINDNSTNKTNNNTLNNIHNNDVTNHHMVNSEIMNIVDDQTNPQSSSANSRANTNNENIKMTRRSMNTNSNNINNRNTDLIYPSHPMTLPWQNYATSPSSIVPPIITSSTTNRMPFCSPSSQHFQNMNFGRSSPSTTNQTVMHLLKQQNAKNIAQHYVIPNSHGIISQQSNNNTINIKSICGSNNLSGISNKFTGHVEPSSTTTQGLKSSEDNGMPMSSGTNDTPTEGHRSNGDNKSMTNQEQSQIRHGPRLKMFKARSRSQHCV